MSAPDAEREALPLPKQPNADGSTPCLIRWMVELPNGLWLGAWDREAFDAYGDARAASGRAQADAGPMPDDLIATYDKGFADGRAQALAEMAALPAVAWWNAELRDFHMHDPGEEGFAALILRPTHPTETAQPGAQP